MATSLNIQLPAPLLSFVEAKIESGEYGSASDYVSKLIAHEQKSFQEHESFFTLPSPELEAYKQKLRLALQNEEGSIELTAEEVFAGNVVQLLRERSKAIQERAKAA